MKRRTNNHRSRDLHVRLSQDEHETLQRKFKTTTYRNLSEYHRALLMQKPVSVRVRNDSLDEFLPVALALKNELHSIAKNFKGAISAEFSLTQKIEEIRTLLIKI